MAQRLAPSLAVVGLACRFPDADDAPELLDVVLTGRRAFRRIPPVRLDLADYFQPDPSTSDATYSTRAALIEGWRFDCAAFGIKPAAFAAADPALWLALETTARALAGAGLAGGTGLDSDRTAVIIGNTLGGDTSRANALRVRWPYVRRVLAEALAKAELSAGPADAVLRRAERLYLAPFPPIGPDTLAGSSAGTIAAAICSYFGLRGGSHAVDSASSSSTQAVATACTALAAGEIDAAVAGGVDISLDPLELIGLAKSGVLASDDVRIYDEQPSGYLPAEGCGVLVLMRTADARAAGLPVYAEIIGWGASSTGRPDQDGLGVSGQLLAMQRAYTLAGVDPAEIQLYEGNGAGIGEDDDAELAALGILRRGAQRPAVLGSVKANIGHAKAASGAAGLIKTVLSLSNGVLPPATGVRHPHPMITDGDAQLTLPQVAAEWPDGVRLAGVSTLTPGGANVHLVLRAEPTARLRPERAWRFRLMPVRTLDSDDLVVPRLMADPTEPVPFLLHAPDRFALAAVLTRLADIARWLSDAEVLDLACSLGRDPAPQGRCRVAIVAAGQEQLGALAAEAADLIPQLADGLLTVRPGIFAAEDADGRVALLLSGAVGRAPDPALADPLTGTVSGCLETLRWLESLDVQATGAVGHGMGALAGLAWAGVLGQSDVVEIADLRAKFLHSSAGAYSTAGAAGNGLAAGQPARPAGSRIAATALRAAIGQRFRFGPPRRRLISTLTGAEIGSVDDAVDLICAGFAGADHLGKAIAAGAVGATLLLETGPGDDLAEVAAAHTAVPAISLGAGFTDPADCSRAAAALFAAGALGQPKPLFAGRPSRPIDIWRQRTFIASPCELRPPAMEPASATAKAELAKTEPAETTPAETATATTELAETTPAETAPAPAETAPAPAEPAPAEATHAATTQPPPAGPPAPAEPAARAQAVQQPAAVSETPADATPAVARPEAVAVRAAGSRPVSLSDLREEFERQPPAPVADLLAGVAPWARCFTEEARPAGELARTGPGLAWRLHVSGNGTRLAAARDIFTSDPAARRTLAIVGDAADDDARAVAVLAAREAVETGRLVVVTTSREFTGFFASLQAEHPAIGVTVLRVPGEDGLRLAAGFARAEPGRFRELILAPDGTAAEPVISEVPLSGGDSAPLGPEDVVLVSRDARGAGLVLAQVLACCGAAVAVIGRPDDDDSELVAGLEQLRSAGARVGYEVIDLANPTSLAAAVRRVEGRLGPVTGIGHAVSPCDPVPLLDMTDIEISDQAASEAVALDRLVGAVRAGQLRMIITFGSVAGRYGLAGGSVTALSSGAVAARAAQLAEAGKYRSLHMDIPAWSDPGLGDRQALADHLAAAGTQPIAVSAASRLLLKVMTTAALPERLALHGRVSGPAARIATESDATALDTTALDATALAKAGLPGGGRFLQDVLVHYPRTELICAPTLSIHTDPYLADCQVDGLAMLPSALALEALAQAASVLAGRPVRAASAVRLESPVIVPAGGQAELRICALREGNTITAVLRCADSSFSVDHARAEFSGLEAAPTSSPTLIAPVAARAVLAQFAGGPAGLVDGSELYGPIAFQNGRFRRIALLPEVSARSCRALARGADHQPWFEPGTRLADGQFLLGSPGLNDASLQVLQACVPHRWLRPAGCSAVWFSGRSAEGAVEIRARAVPDVAVPPPVSAIPAQAPAPAAEASPAPGPAGQPHLSPSAQLPVIAAQSADQQAAGEQPAGRQAASELAAAWRLQPRKARREERRLRRDQLMAERRRAAQTSPADPADPARSGRSAAVPQLAAAEQQHTTGRAAATRTAGRHISGQRWDIDAVDAAGQLLVAWRGVEVRDAGPLPRTSAWPPALLAVYLERCCCDAGLDASLRVTVSCGNPARFGSRLLAASVPAQSPGDRSGAAAAAGRAPARRGQADGQPADAGRTAASEGSGLLAGFSLAATAAVPVACAWSAVETGHRHDRPPAASARVYAQLGDQLAEPLAFVAARLRVIGSCLAAAGLPPEDAGEWAPSATISRDGWLRLRTATASVACTVVEVSGVPAPVAVAVLTGLVPAGPAAAGDGPRAATGREPVTTGSVPG